MTAHSPTNEWNELNAAKASEAEFKRIMEGHVPTVSRSQLMQAKRDAMRAMVVGLPCPEQVARKLETVDPRLAEALRIAWIGKAQPYAGVWRVAEDEHTATLRALGLVGWINESDGCAVGNFGLAVRKCLLGEAERDDG